MDNEQYEDLDIIVVTDEDGKEIEFELLDRYETDEDVYVAITEFHDSTEEIIEASYEVIFLKVVYDENDNEMLEEIQDKMEYEQISDIMMARIEEKYEIEYFDENSIEQ